MSCIITWCAKISVSPSGLIGRWGPAGFEFARLSRRLPRHLLLYVTGYIYSTHLTSEIPTLATATTYILYQYQVYQIDYGLAIKYQISNINIKYQMRNALAISYIET
jgi:hypothetical protein